jgi:GNAT superfamily N-acetyltransferase
VGDGVTVEPESGSRDRKAFLDLPYRLYAGHPTWVPPLRSGEAKNMDPERNPFFRHGEVKHFLARRGGRVVGRIAAIENRLHNEVHGERAGFFGYFDAENDPAATRQLVEAAGQWTSARGLFPMRGPVCYSTNDPCGVLVEGFDETPAILMPYNRPDYDDLLRQAGLVGVKDLVAYEIPSAPPAPERFMRVVERRLERGGIRLRPYDLKHFGDEVQRVRDLYNRCWEKNWGFVPATDEEFDAAASDLKTLLDNDLSAVAERDGTPVGFSVVLKDLNRVLRGLDGRLFPFGFLKLLWRMRRIDHVRVITLGVVPEARGRAINEALFLHAYLGAKRKGYVGGEAGWVLEDNQAMRSPIESVGGRVTKRYRLYETPEAERRRFRRAEDE